MLHNLHLISIGKGISKISQLLNRGNGSTWPGHIALKGNKNFIKDVLSHSKIKTIIVVGTNGKTTTSGLIQTGLEKNGKKVIQNNSGANLLNGIASSLLLHTNSQGKLTQDFALFEVDENALPAVLEQITPDYLVLLNLFRDQLDRYGEINTIAQKWHDAIDNLPEKTKLILNADDPQIAAIPVFLRIQEKHVLYFGLHDKTIMHTQLGNAADSVTCPRCDTQLIFTEIMFSHLGNWYCKKCGLKRPKITLNKFGIYPLSGTYNKYNTHAAALLLEALGITEEQIITAFADFKPSFGRQEIIEYHERHVQLFLSKNPTSFNQSYATIKELNGTSLIIVLNDRIPDGRDISWIWDTDLPEIDGFKHIFITGDRMYDMAVRLKYEMGIQKFADKVQTFEVLKDAIDAAITITSVDEIIYILPTYSAMLDVRKIITGKKIL